MSLQRKIMHRSRAPEWIGTLAPVVNWVSGMLLFKKVPVKLGQFDILHMNQENSLFWVY